MKTRTCRDGALKTNPTNGNDTTTLSHHPYILYHFATAYRNLFVSCVQRRVVEGSVVSSA